jgi:integrase
MNSKLIPDFDKKKIPTKRELLILENLRKCKKITDYLEYRLNRDSTKRTFATHIRNYFLFLDISDVDSYFKDPRRMSNGKRIDYMDKIEHDIESYNNSLKSYSGSFRLSNLSAIRKLLEYNKIDLGNSFWEGVRKAGAKAERESEIETPTIEQLRNILSRADNEGKAFFLIQMSSGSRVEEIRTLTFNNLYLNTDPPSFRITKEHSKTGRAITKFFSYEALEFLKQYLDKDRDRILLTRLNRARNQKTKDDYKNQVFPMGKTNPEIIWSNLCKKEGLYKLDPKTKHPIMGTHSLRRFFEDNIGHGKLSKYMLNKLSKSEEAYSFKTKNKLEGLYKKHMDNLFIFNTPKKTKEEINKLKEDLAKKDGEIKRLKEGMDFIDKGRKSFETQAKEFEERIGKIENNLHVSLNPESPDTQDTIDKVLPYLIKSAESLYKRKATKEELDEIKPGLKLVLNYLKDKSADEISDLVKPENLPDLYEQIKKKKGLNKNPP